MIRGLLSFTIIFMLASCGQDYNSSSFDDTKYKPVTGTQDFTLAYNVLIENCTQTCHTHSTWSTYDEQEDWIAKDLVIANDFANSPIIYRLQNYGGNMPLAGSKLTDSELEYLRNWIESL